MSADLLKQRITALELDLERVTAERDEARRSFDVLARFGVRTAPADEPPLPHKASSAASWPSPPAPEPPPPPGPGRWAPGRRPPEPSAPSDVRGNCRCPACTSPLPEPPAPPVPTTVPPPPLGPGCRCDQCAAKRGIAPHIVNCRCSACVSKDRVHPVTGELLTECICCANCGAIGPDTSRFEVFGCGACGATPDEAIKPKGVRS